MIFGKPPDHLIKVATLIKDFWRLWVPSISQIETVGEFWVVASGAGCGLTATLMLWVMSVGLVVRIHNFAWRDSSVGKSKNGTM